MLALATRSGDGVQIGRASGSPSLARDSFTLLLPPRTMPLPASRVEAPPCGRDLPRGAADRQRERIRSVAMSQRVAFLGLGVMGRPMAGHLLRAGHYARGLQPERRQGGALRGRVRRTRRSEPRRGRAGRASSCFVCVGGDDDVRAVILGADGALGALSPGAVIVDHTTTSATLARELAAAARARDVAFLDAPVSGGQQGAERGALTVMAGGDAAAFARAQPLLAAYARTARLLGESGSGQLAKMVNQICIAGLIEALAEGLAFARAAGLDARAVVEVISQGAAGSWQLENRAESMLDGRFDFGFAVDWMRKDLGIALAEARRNGASAARDRAGGPALRRGPGPGRRTLGHLEPDRTAASGRPEVGVSADETRPLLAGGGQALQRDVPLEEALGPVELMAQAARAAAAGCRARRGHLLDTRRRGRGGHSRRGGRGTRRACWPMPSARGPPSSS